MFCAFRAKLQWIRALHVLQLLLCAMQVATDCCDILGSAWLFGDSSLPDVCGASPVATGSDCYSESFAGTYDVCAAQGARMCTASESLVPNNSGCGYNNQFFWSQTSCVDGSGDEGMYAVRASLFSGVAQECRTDLTQVLSVRCCSDTCN